MQAAPQRKASPGPPSETEPALERQADRAAERVVLHRAAGLLPGLAPLPGGVGVQRKCACGGTCDRCKQQGEDEDLRLQRAPENGTVPAAGPRALADDAAPSFMAELRRRLSAVCDEELAQIGRSAQGCPYLEHWLGYYESRPAAVIERAARRYTDGAAGDTQQLLEAVVQRVRGAVKVWTTTGSLSGVPDPSSVLSGTGDPSGGVLQAKSETAGPSPAADPGAVQAQLGAGTSLDAGVRARMERGFGRSFADVRVHTDPTAARLSHGLSARAFTVGRDVAFGAGEYQPGTLPGDLLIAHELAHTVQQSGGRAEALGSEAQLEDDADRAAVGAVGGTGLARPQGRTGLRLQGCGKGKEKTKPPPSPLPACPAVPGAPAQEPPVVQTPAASPVAAPSPAGLGADFVVHGRRQTSLPSGTPLRVFFAENSATLDAAGSARLCAFAHAHPTQDVTLNGFVSEEEDAAVAAARNTAVAAELKGFGHTGNVNPVDRVSGREGRLDYRNLRSVEVLLPGETTAEPDCARAARVAPCTAAWDGTFFTPAFREGKTMLQKTIDALGKSPLDAGTARALKERFLSDSPVKAKTVRAKLLKVQKQFLDIEARHQCGTACDPTCRTAIAYNNGTGSSSITTLCPRFELSGPVESAVVLIHETTHATMGLGAATDPDDGTSDEAYRWERRFATLPEAMRTRNADHYAILVSDLAAPAGSFSFTPAPVDEVADSTGGALRPRDEETARKSVALMQKWLIWAQQWTAGAYKSIIKVRGGEAWSDVAYEGVMAEAAFQFGLTAPPATPTSTDQFQMAAIQDRYLQVSQFVRQTKLKLLRDPAAGGTRWGSGPGSEVTLGQDFWAMGDFDLRAHLLLAALIDEVGEIGSAHKSKYVALAYEIQRLYREAHGG